MSDWFRKLVTKAIRVNGVEQPNQPALNIVAGTGIGIESESLNVAAENNSYKGETRVTLSVDVEALAEAVSEDPALIAAAEEAAEGAVSSVDLSSVLANGANASGIEIVNLGAPAAPTSAAREQDVTLARALANDPDAGGATARRLVLGSTAATTIPASAENTEIGYSEEIGARRRTGSSAVGVQVFQRVSRSTFDAASLTLISGGISASEIPADCMIVAEADVVAVGSVRYAARLTGTFQVAAGTITKLFDAAIGPPLPAELSTLHFNITSDAIGVQLVQPSAGPSWTLTTRTKFTVVEDPS